MNQIEQTWKAQGYNDADIAKMSAVMNHPDACKYALETRDFEKAYQMTLPKEESQINLNTWFSSFIDSEPDDAKSLSIALTKFARFIQSQVDKSSDKWFITHLGGFLFNS